MKTTDKQRSPPGRESAPSKPQGYNIKRKNMESYPYNFDLAEGGRLLSNAPGLPLLSAPGWSDQGGISRFDTYTFLIIGFPLALTWFQ